MFSSSNPGPPDSLIDPMVLDREWKKGIVANVLHAAGFYQVIVFPEEAANAEGSAVPIYLTHW